MNAAASYPLDGPHGAATIVQAARDVEHLTRYLCRATRHRSLLNNPADATAALGALHGTAAMLFQLFDQLAQTADLWTNQPGLYDHRRDNPGVTATHVGLQLRGAAAASLPLAAQLAAAHEACSRLGVQHTKENP